MKDRFIVQDIKRIAATDVAACTHSHGHRLRSIGRTIVDRCNVKRGAALSIENGDRGRYGRFACVIARKGDHQVATRIGPTHRGSGGRSPGCLRDRCICNG